MASFGSSATKVNASSPALIRLTFRYVKVALWSRRTLLIWLLASSVILGVVPTLKSELESGVIEEISQNIHRKPGLREAFQHPLGRFRSEAAPANTSGVIERLASIIFFRLSLWEGLGVYFLIGAIGFAFELASARASAGLGVEIFRSLRLQGLKRGLEAEPGAIESMPNTPGQFTAAIQQGATNASETYEYLLDAAQQSVSVATVIVLLATRSVWFSVGCIVLVSGQAGISVLQARRLKTARNDLDSRRNDLAARTDDILSKKEIILAWEQQARYASKLDSYASDFAEVDRRLKVTESVYRNASILLTDYGRIGVLLLALVLALTLSGPAVSNIGDAYFLISLYVRLFVPVTNLLSRYDSIRRSEATSRTYLELLAQPLPQALTASAMVPVGARGLEVVLEGIGYLYSPGPPPKGLTDCSFKIPAGSVTLLLGPSGCGKTTMARLLLGFMKPQSGRIFLDGRDTVSMSGPELRLFMSYVSQGDYVIDDTVRENLSWSPAELSDAELCKALSDLRIVEPSQALALLDKSARSLSIGQQQRLSLCRVLLDRAPFLIMDEPLTGVDLFTLQDVMPALIRSITETRRTVLLISHRVGFVSHADHVVIMDHQGIVSEEGNPAEMLRNPLSSLAKLHKTALVELGAPGIAENIEKPERTI